MYHPHRTESSTRPQASSHSIVVFSNLPSTQCIPHICEWMMNAYVNECLNSWEDKQSWLKPLTFQKTRIWLQFFLTGSTLERVWKHGCRWSDFYPRIALVQRPCGAALGCTFTGFQTSLSGYTNRNFTLCREDDYLYWVGRYDSVSLFLMWPFKTESAQVVRDPCFSISLSTYSPMLWCSKEEAGSQCWCSCSLVQWNFCQGKDFVVPKSVDLLQLFC